MALLVFQCIAKCYLRLTEIFYFKLSAELEVKKFVGRTNIIGFFPCWSIVTVAVVLLGTQGGLS